MHIRSVHIQTCKTFSDLIIQDLPATARLVVMIGPNGCGKSSVFDAFRIWLGLNAGVNRSSDELYYHKDGLPVLDWNKLVQIDFHESLPTDIEEKRKLFYIRSAYRNQPDFTVNRLQRASPLTQSPRVERLIDNDASVSDNYNRLVSATIAGVYSGELDSLTVEHLRERFIGQIRDSMSRVFDDLMLKGTGDPLTAGSFYFEKGLSRNFHYKNLSGGEKAAFDVLLDFILTREIYSNTVFCIDEPEAHMHTGLQAHLLEELIGLIPAECQLWIATHSIGMMRKARDLKKANPDQVIFLGFYDKDFDTQVTLAPVQVTRRFWSSTLKIALDDLASLVAPEQVIICEGRPAASANDQEAGFDAQCYHTIFATEFPGAAFISAGNAAGIQTDRLQISRVIESLLSGTELLRLVDRDDRSATEISNLQSQGVRVLARRHLEAYLLDDEVLSSLCCTTGNPDKVDEVLAAKQEAMQASQARGNAPDDVKSAAGEIYNKVKRILKLTKCGNTSRAFLRDTMAPLVVPGLRVYAELRKGIFDQ